METQSSVEQMDIETQPQGTDFNLYRLEGHGCTLLEAKKDIDGASSTSGDTFSILMADVSGSMAVSWAGVMAGWNDHVVNKLVGTIKFFFFNHDVISCEGDTQLNQSHFRGGGTNITRALEVLSSEVDGCPHTFVNVFIITDGQHGGGEPWPETQISRMRVPPGKTVNVFLLGISANFPVNYSIDIRSLLHNGNANMPPLYWARDVSEIVEKMKDMGTDLSAGNVKMTINHEGYALPGLDSTSVISPGEWLYFPKPPEQMPPLKVTLDSVTKEIPHNTKNSSVSVLLDHVFPQWNSLLIQQHRKKLPVPKETFDLMESLFQSGMSRLKNIPLDKTACVKDRLARKAIRSLEVKFATLMNASRTIINVEGKYENEIELANSILKSTVSSDKYGTKVLKIRGHGMDDFENDIAAFRTIYMKAKPSIMALPPPPMEDCCRITVSSTLSDLQDEDFHLLLDEGKYDLLKDFTMTGIPAYAPVKDASQINVWTLTIRHMLVTPFAVLSQLAIEAKAGMEGPDNALGFIDKEVQLVADDEKTRFNIIIPVVPASACNALRPVVRSNFYAMMSTFCILKNPHIIDHSAHLAALACVWLKSITEHTPPSRPSYVVDRLVAVTATAELYMDRKAILRYLNVLTTAPRQALMTESSETFDEHTLKCESLVKPLFFLAMRKESVTAHQLQEYLKLLLAEYVGRCLSNYKTKSEEAKDATPFIDFFCPQLKDSKEEEKQLTKLSQSMISEFKSSHNNLLKEFYAPENLQKSIKMFLISKATCLKDGLMDTLTLAVNMDKVKRLRNVGSCGDLQFPTFGRWAEEMCVPEEQIKGAYDPSQVFVYVCEALLHRNSRDRLSQEPQSYAQCLHKVKTQVIKEYEKSFPKILKMIEEGLLGEWKEKYFAVHKSVVMPLSRKEIIVQAQSREIQVTEENFHQVYRRYNEEHKMLRNACQIPGCPHYLLPNRRFNQHLAVERLAASFPQALHLVCKKLCKENASKVIEELRTGCHSGRQGRVKCPLTEPQSLYKYEQEIMQLLNIYKQQVT